MKLKDQIKLINEGGLIHYKHTDESHESSYLIANTNVINEQSIGYFIEHGKQYQVLTSAQIIQSIVSTESLHNNAMVIPFDCSKEGLISFCQELSVTNVNNLKGNDSIAINPFPEGNVLNINTPDSFIAEIVSLLDKEPEFFIITKCLNNIPSSIPSITTEDIELSRVENPALLSHTGVVDTHLNNGNFEVHSFYSPFDHFYHWAFTTKNFASKNTKEAPLIRIESECLTGHVLGSLLCDCGDQLKQGLKKIEEYGYGALIYLRQEGRGIGLLGKIRAYKLQQEEKLDTVDANLALGEPADSRNYLIGAQILNYFDKNTIKLLTNNPKKEVGLKKYNISIEERVEHIIPPGKHNKKYLKTKADRLGHLM
jgi:GTP cyclohydrolase II